MIPPSNWQIFKLFFLVGCQGFGGFMSLISAIQRVVIEDKKWVSLTKFTDGIALAGMLPGAQAVNVTTYTGFLIKGNIGAFLAALGVIIPSFVLMIVLCMLYEKGAGLAFVDKIFSGMMPAVVSIILFAFIKLAKKHVIGNWLSIFICISAGLLVVFCPPSLRFYSTIFIVFAAGLLGFIGAKKAEITEAKSSETITNKKWLLPLVLFTIVVVALLIPTHFAWPILNVMKRLAATSMSMFGGGYVIIPMLQDLVVNQYSWLNEDQFINGIALSQIMPGPILIISAYIGFKVAHIPGAVLATMAMFMPTALFMVYVSKMYMLLLGNATVQKIMSGMRPATTGLIGAAVYFVSVKALPNPLSMTDPILYKSLAIFLLASFCLYKWKWNNLKLLLLAGLAGMLIF